MGLQVSDFAQPFEVFWFCAISLPNQDSVAMASTGPRGATDQGHQQDPAFITLNPQPERVLLVTQEETALASLERAPTQGRALGRIASGALFLCPEAEAGRSVASMSATETVPALPWAAAVPTSVG